MKRCPECRRDYYDDSLFYCLDDGNALVEAPASRNEQATAIIQGDKVREEMPTRLYPPSESRTGQGARRTFTGLRYKLALLVTGTLLLGSFLVYRYVPFGTEAQIESIAVLPFVNETGNPEFDYLSDGMTETLMGSLSRIPGLKVKSRSSVFRYKGKDVTPRVVGSELNVQAILNGRVVGRGQNVTVYLELVNAVSEDVLWKSAYNKPISNLTALQSDIARDVAGNLRARLSGIEVSHVTKRYTENAEAYELYLRGRYAAAGPVTESSIRQSIQYYQQAIDKDPNYALAYVGLAQLYLRLGHVWGFVPPREALPSARPAIEKALQLDDNLAEAHAAMGDYKLSYEWAWPEADHELKRAIELDPNNSAAYATYGTYFQTIVQFDTAEDYRKRTRELDPLSAVATANVGYPRYYGGDYDGAIAWFRKALELDPNFAWSHLWIGQALTEKNMPNEAIVEIEKAIAMSTGNIRMKATLGYAHARAGDRPRAENIIKELKEASKVSYVSPYFIAIIYSGLGDKDQAFTWLEQAFEERHPYLILLRAEPVFNNIRSDPRFQDLVNRVGIPQ